MTHKSLIKVKCVVANYPVYCPLPKYKYLTYWKCYYFTIGLKDDNKKYKAIAGIYRHQ
jgi:hypothetical protein